MISRICRILRLKYIPILHGGNLPERLSKNPRLCDSIFKYSECNVSPSHYLRSVFQEFGYTNTVFIPNAIDIQRYPNHDKEYDIPRLFWLRSFSKIYNPKLAVSVLNQIRHHYKEAELCMVGPDSDGSRKAIEDYAKELDLNVTFTGKLDKQDWIDLSKNYNIFINTSNFDNMPVSVLEAMALGFPIVSTNVGGMPYLMENEVHGLLVNPDNEMEMSKGVKTVFENLETRDYIIKNARELAETFDWTKVKSKWHNIFHD